MKPVLRRWAQQQGEPFAAQGLPQAPQQGQVPARCFWQSPSPGSQNQADQARTPAARAMSVGAQATPGAPRPPHRHTTASHRHAAAIARAVASARKGSRIPPPRQEWRGHGDPASVVDPVGLRGRQRRPPESEGVRSRSGPPGWRAGGALSLPGPATPSQLLGSALISMAPGPGLCPQIPSRSAPLAASIARG